MGMLARGIAVVVGAAVAALIVKQVLDRRRDGPLAAVGNGGGGGPADGGSEPEIREVTATGKDETGRVISLHGEWGEVSKEEAIRAIEAGEARYRVTGGQDLMVVAGPSGKYLRSRPGGGTADNLDELPSPDELAASESS